MLKRSGIISLFALLFAIIFAAGCVGLEEFMGQNENFSINISQKNLTSRLYGSVMNLEKEPLENVSVILIGNSSNYTGLTDANGRYNVTGVRAGTYKVVVWKAEYRNVSLAKFAILGGYSYPWNVTLTSISSGFYGTVTNLKKEPLENASILLMGNASNYTGLSDASGKYNVSGVRAGIYNIVVWKAGHKNATLANFTILEGYSYPWNVTIARDCLYYTVNASTNYVLRYGFNGTLYRGSMEFNVSYPEGAAYDVYPTARNGFSEISTGYVAGNRMLEWMLDNSAGRYSYVQGHIYINMNGTGTMQLYDRREMNLSDAAAFQPGYLGGETNAAGKKLINPSNSEIKEIAEQVKNESGSDDAWTLARALFLWLKNNTVYYIDPSTSDYSHTPIEVLHSGRGKCDELSRLYISLLRADGIPARFVKGYLVERNPDRYISHVWAEFYDGEWVPVEVAGPGNASAEADTHFGVQRPDHVAVFIDDGTNDAINEGDFSGGLYYDQPSAFPFSIYYDAIGYNQTYIAVCSDGTRELKAEME